MRSGFGIGVSLAVHEPDPAFDILQTVWLTVFAFTEVTAFALKPPYRRGFLLRRALKRRNS